MPPIISVVGRSNTGKTTMLVGIIQELKQRGHRVAIIKHSREDFELDQRGKDTWHFAQAGGEVVAISSPHKLAIIKPMERDLSPQELIQYFGWDYDLMLTEGFKTSDTPKIELHLGGPGTALLSPPQQLIAAVSDEPLEVTVPQFRRDDIKGLADFIESWLALQAAKREEDFELFVDHKPVPMNRPIKDLLSRTLVAMVSGLKGVKEIKSLHISLRRNP
ncbi:MAG: molybdopterin-guanine dinucleotide biosynthesis protein B [Chloroflexi bacterium]|nr:molybdopterin-guanine dinucleotide biosynthesis protein B [Chloroflexota bacterium]